MNELMEKRRAEYEAGNRLALMLAIQTCRAMGWPWPEWVSTVVRQTLESAIETGRTDELPNMLFGRGTPKANVRAIDDEGTLQCWELLTEMKAGGQLHRPDGGEASVMTILAEFIAWYTMDPEGVSVRTLQKQIGRARERRPSVPSFVAIGYELPMCAFLADRGYWGAKP